MFSARTSSQPSADGTGSAGPSACSRRSSSAGKSFIPASLTRPATDAAWSAGPHHAGTDPGGPDADRALSALTQNDLFGTTPDGHRGDRVTGHIGGFARVLGVCAVAEG